MGNNTKRENNNFSPFYGEISTQKQAEMSCDFFRIQDVKSLWWFVCAESQIYLFISVIMS